MSQGKNWIFNLTSKKQPSSSSHQGTNRQTSYSEESTSPEGAKQPLAYRQSSVEEKRALFDSKALANQAPKQRNRKNDDNVHQPRDKSKGRYQDHRTESGIGHNFGNRDFERNQTPQRKVFGPQLRDLEDDYYAPTSRSYAVKGHDSSRSYDQNPQRRSDSPRRKILPQIPTEASAQLKDRGASKTTNASQGKGNYPREYSKPRHASMQYLDPKNKRYHTRDDKIQKVVEELHTKGIGQDSSSSTRRTVKYDRSLSLDSSIPFDETSQQRKVIPLRSSYSRESFTRQDSGDYSNQGYNRNEASDSTKLNRSQSRNMKSQRPAYDDKANMEEWGKRIQSPEQAFGHLSRSRTRSTKEVVEEFRSRDNTPQRKKESSRSRDRTPQRKRETSRSRDHTPQRKKEPSRSRDHTPQRKKEPSRLRDHTPQRKKEPSRSRDHTPQRKKPDSPRSRDHTPDSMTFMSRSREDLRTKHFYISLPQEKAKHMSRYLQEIDSRSRESLTSLSGEKKNVRPGAPSEPNEYNFNYKRRGLFIIINNKNFHPETGQQAREGTDVDAERLEERFQDLGFEVKRYDDVTRSKMSTLMYDAASYDHSDADCFGCAILSHGVEGRVYGIDGYVSLEVLVMPFKGDKCPTLVGKPKLFFLQACRGTKMDYGVNVSDSSLSSRDEDEVDASSTVSIRKIPIEADFLFAYSTVPGYYSWRNNQDGSWFIQALCIVMENYGMKMELLHMLTHVNRIVAYEFASCTDREFTDKMKQMPCVVSMLTRYVYFRHKKQDIR